MAVLKLKINPLSTRFRLLSVPTHNALIASCIDNLNPTGTCKRVFVLRDNEMKDYAESKPFSLYPIV